MAGVVLANRQISLKQPKGQFSPNWGSPQANALLLWVPLVPQWQGGMNLVRASPAGLVGTQVNGFTWGTAYTGASQYGLGGPTFDGTDDRLDFSAAADLATSPVTISAWMVTTDIASTRYIVNCARSGGGFGIPFFISTNAGNGALGVLRSYNSGASQKNALSAAGTISTNVWYHVVVTDPATSANGTDFTFYVNGVALTGLTTSNATGSPDATTANWTVGGRASDNARNWQGSLADVRVYNRCMTANEVSDLYNPRSRWDLYWQPSRRVYVFQSSTTRHQWMPLLGVN